MQRGQHMERYVVHDLIIFDRDYDEEMLKILTNTMITDSLKEM